MSIRNLFFQLLCLVGPVFSLSGQAADSSKINIRFNIGAGATTTQGFSDAINLDPYIERQRQRNYRQYYTTGRLTDHPHDHGSIFANLSSKTTFRPGYELYANLLMEHRGASYGANDLNNIVVVPQLYGRIRDTFFIHSKPINLFFHVGDAFQYKLNQGLQVYNTDLQVIVFKLEYSDYIFKVVHVPDYSAGIGLALEEVFSINLGYKLNSHRFNFSYDLNSNVPFSASRFSLPNKSYSHLSFDYKYKWKAHDLYFQLGCRNFDDKFSARSAAFVIGSELDFSTSVLDLTLNPEVRYYSSLCNRGYFSPDNFFRNNRNSRHHSNTVGEFLYPLKNYHYPFSQWSVFAEYQDLDVLGLGLNADLNIKFNKEFGCQINADYLGVNANDKFFNYMFYTFSLYYEPIKNLYIKGFFTNKAMNLDVHYQTFYMTTIPVVGLGMRKIMNPYW